MDMTRTENFRNVAPRFAAILGRTAGVRVSFRGRVPYTDGRTMVLPTMPGGTMMTKEEAEFMDGYLDHETCHLRYTFPEPGPEPKHILNKDLCGLYNMFEDLRIERMMIGEYPGTRVGLDAIAQKVFWKLEKMGHGNPVSELMLQVAAYLWTAFRELPQVVLGEELKRNPETSGLPALLDTLGAKLKTREDAYECAKELYAALKALLEQKKDEQKKNQADKPAPQKGPSGEGPSGEGPSGDGEPGDGEPGDGEPGDGEPGDGEPGEGEPGEGGGPSGQGGEESESEESDQPGGGSEGQDGEPGEEGQGPAGDRKPRGNVEDPEDDQDGDEDPVEQNVDPKDERGLPGKKRGEKVPDREDAIRELLDETLDKIADGNDIQVGKPKPDQDGPGAYGSNQNRGTKILPPVSIDKDEEITVTATDTAKLFDLRAKYGADVAKAKRNLQVFMLSRDRRAWATGLEEGAHLDEDRLAYLKYGARDVFKNKRDRTMPNTAVELMVDWSGSMNRDAALTAMLVLAEAIGPLPRVKLAISAFTSDVGEMISSRVAVPDLTGMGRNEPLRIYRLKDFGTPYYTAAPVVAGFHAEQNSTPLGDAYARAYEDLMARPEPRKILILVTDGQPAFYMADTEHSDFLLMEKIHARCKLAGIETIGLEVSCNAGVVLKRYVDRHATVVTHDDLAAGIVATTRAAFDASERD